LSHDSLPALSADASIPFCDFQQLLAFATSPEVLTATLVERRQRFLTEICQILKGDLGIWTWGRGFSVEDGLTPMAVIDHGMSLQQKVCMAEMALDRRNDLEFRSLIIPLMDDQRNATLLRQDLYDDAAWEKRPWFRKLSEGIGMQNWLMGIRYPRPDTWFNVTIWRTRDRGPFTPGDRQFLSLALNSISWLHPTAAELLPPRTYEELTRRQRAVLLLLLDGMSRKSVALHLGLTEHTVGDHIKSIYQKFNVHSLNELVAMMMKSS